MTGTAHTPRLPGRPRSQEVDAAILGAALDVDDRTAAVTVAATRGIIRLGG
ncbi:hypothetical protein ABGB18_33280 [Nonomuraea sp. B12E4]|uniref:hypothetical protein n=1 Tax=Nonomuraea sp. B12E4 TaxID=3153564 RepID=UPI00325EFF03